MAAPDRVGFDNGIGAFASEAQRQAVAASFVVLAVDHRPLVQPETTGVRAP